MTVRADAGFFSYDMIAALGAHGASYSITIGRNAKVNTAIAGRCQLVCVRRGGGHVRRLGVAVGSGWLAG